MLFIALFDMLARLAEGAMRDARAAACVCAKVNGDRSPLTSPHPALAVEASAAPTASACKTRVVNRVFSFILSKPLSVAGVPSWILPSYALKAQTARENCNVAGFFSKIGQMGESTTKTTQLLRAWASGDQQALSVLVPRVYRELRRLAGRCLRNERAGQTLQVTDLVHEAYLHLAGTSQIDWQDRSHFFAVSATLMRRILVDRARRRTAAKRGGRVAEINIEQALDLSTRRSAELIALDDALKTLAGVDPRKARIVELRFFAGLEVKETAAVVGVSPETVMRDWKLAKAWLLKELRASD
jgi:RNA polymerase sigma factor (TIGR02999 family)